MFITGVKGIGSNIEEPDAAPADFSNFTCSVKNGSSEVLLDIVYANVPPNI